MRMSVQIVKDNVRCSPAFGNIGRPQLTVAALVPASPWLDSVPPQIPTVRTGRDAGSGALILNLQPQGTEPTWLWVIRARTGTQWTTDIVPGFHRSYAFPVSSTSPDAVVVTAVDRTGNESAPLIAGVAPAR